MLQKNNAHPSQAETSATKDTRNSTGSTIKLTPRQHRALVALVYAQDWLAREAIDRIARASNGPATIQALRCKLGNDAAIEMKRVPVIDADGKTARAGRYRLSDTHRAQAVALLGGGGHA